MVQARDQRSALLDVTTDLCNTEKVEVGGACSANGGEDEYVEIIGRKARGKETTRKTKI
jgi:hypothetical protein